MSKFKVGDRLIVNKDRPWSAGVKRGELVTYIGFDKVKDGSGMTWTFSEWANDDPRSAEYKSYILLGEEVNKMAQTFKKGDLMWPIPADFYAGCSVLQREIRNGNVSKIEFVEYTDEDDPNDDSCRWIAYDKSGKQILNTCCWLNGEKMKKVSATGLMTKISILAKKLLDADVKALVEAGYLNDKLELTEEGKEAVLTHYLNANKKALADEARAVLAEAKKAE
jgi:hypothetical protein